MKCVPLGLVAAAALALCGVRAGGSAATGMKAGCYTRSSYNACLNCCVGGGHGAECEQACWNVYRRFRTPGNPVVPV